MKTEAKKVFTKEVSIIGADRFNLKLPSLKELAGFENYIYEGITFDDEEVVIRYCHSSHRNQEEIEAELDWLFYLKDQGASVCGPLYSKNRQLVEEVTASDGSSFFISVFEKAKGDRVDIGSNRSNKLLFYRWGKATGELHRLTKNYQPSATITPRQDYMEMSSIVFSSYLPSDKDVKEKVDNLFQTIERLPKGDSTYLLTHTDLHLGNFFYDGDRLWIFDFDDCSYHHIMHDLAMPLYYCLWLFEGTSEEKAEFAELFFTHYLAGYLSEYEITSENLEKVSLFLRLRDCDLYAILQEEWKGQEMTERRTRLLEEMHNRIVHEQPVVELLYKAIHEKAKFITY